MYVVPVLSGIMNVIAPADWIIGVIPLSDAGPVSNELLHAATTTRGAASPARRCMRGNYQTPGASCTLDEAAPHVRLAPRAHAEGGDARARARGVPRVVARNVQA